LGIQYLSESLHRKVFPNHDSTAYANPKYPLLIDIAKDHLKHNQLLGKKTLITEPINIDNFPLIIGKSLDQHFYNIGKQSSVPYYEMAESFLSSTLELPRKPSKWEFKSGWTRYAPNEAPESVEFPLEDELVFDVEVLYKRSKYPIMATCVSPEAWYGWVSPYLTKESDDWEHLIKLDVLKKPKLVIGYNISFDRASVLDEYNIKQSKAFYLDAMALHVAVSGICSQQRPKWMKHKKNKQLLDEEDAEIESDSPVDESAFTVFAQQEISRQIETELNEDPWLNKGSTNSLANVASFHCGLKMDKSDRDYFSGEDPQDIVNNFNSLMNYCSKDVEATFAVGKKLFPEFISKCPHPVSFSALRHLGTLMLPTSRKWDNYIQAAEEIYQSNRLQVTKNLCDRANELVAYIEEKDESLKPDLTDPWLRQLDWLIKEPRLKKNGEPVANQAFLTGYPQWYRDLFKSVPGKKGEREMNLTVRTRITPLLLRLKWEGYTLLWTNSNGWCFKVPDIESVSEEMEKKNYVKANLTEDEIISLLDELREETKNYVLFKVPHPDGASKRCTSILSKRYLQYFENGILTSEYNFAHEIIGLNTSASYWMGNRQRIMDQLVVYNDTTHKKSQFFDTKKESQANSDMGIILPRLCSMGTITRRATENTWLTASNAKKNRIGSELKSLVEAPPGYVFVGADVDSEELWIASLVGDSMFNIHGGTALGWMTLEGDKNEKTDLHSKTAEILGISRNDAKVFNYGRIYGAGVKFATRLLQQCNPNISQKEAETTAAALYEKTKGSISASNVFPKPVYHGGSESIMFNALEAIAYQKQPRTPVLGSAITDALAAKNLNKNSYLTSRINWTIQSSGVDYLHLLIVSMEYLLDLFQVQNARLAITVHDELRYMVRYEDRYKVALILQISNLWTRAMFCEQLGIKEVPQSCAFFSEVDIDRYLRKDVNADCITPSNVVALPPGESLDIKQLLMKTENGKILPVKKKKINKLFKYNPRTPVISTLENETDINLKVAKLQAQNSTSKKNFRQNIGLYIKLKEMGDGKKHNKKSEVKPVKSKKTNTTNKNKSKDTTRSRTAAKILPEIELGSEDCGQLAKEVEKFRPRNKHTRSVPNRPRAIKSRILRRLTGNSTMGQLKVKLNTRLRSHIFRRPDDRNTVKLSA
jgi:DNA polymerase gamma 1